jgi:hypothetical protein
MSVRLGSRIRIGLIVGALALSVCIIPLHHDLWRSYITTSDADIIFIYEALRYNDRAPQWQFDHPGYTYQLLLAAWVRVLHVAGLSEIIRLSEILGLPGDRFESAYAQLVFAGRLLSIIFAAAFVVMFFLLLRRLTREDVAAACAIVFAFGVGIANQSIILRTELLSSFFSVLAFAAVVGAARAADGRFEVLMAMAGASAILAMATKVQAIFLLMGLPILAILFGARPPIYAGRSGEGERSGISIILILVAVAVALPASMMIVRGIQFESGSGIYQAAIALYVAVAMITYSFIYQVPRRRTASGLAAMAIGISVGFFALLIYHHPGNLLTIVNFGHRSLAHSRSFAEPGGVPSLQALLTPVLEGFWVVFKQRTIAIDPLHEPYRIIEWLMLIGILYASWRRRWLLALQTASLFGLAIAFEAAANLRWFRADYRIYTDPWLLIAAALLLNDRVASHDRRDAIAASLGLVMIFVIGASVNRAWQPDFVPRQPASNACYQASTFQAPIAERFQHYCQ